MQLLRITGQSKGLREFYDVSRDWADHWHKPIEAMRALVVYLEEAVDFPAQWVFTSHENLIFSGQDDSRHWLVRVHPLGKVHDGPARAKYEIQRPLQSPWTSATGYAADEQEAWLLIASVLTDALTVYPKSIDPAW